MSKHKNKIIRAEKITEKCTSVYFINRKINLLNNPLAIIFNNH